MNESTLNKRTLVVVGSSFKMAPLDVLESLSTSPDDVQRLLPILKKQFNAEEIVFLSTCNRTEIYATSAEPTLTILAIENFFINPNSGDQIINNTHLYSHSSCNALKHLMNVATGLDSLILGETEITGQVQRALLIAKNSKTTGSFLEQIFSSVFRAAKRSRTETAIDHGNTSVASASVHLAQRIFGNLCNSSVLIIGAGDTGSLLARYVKDLSPQSLTICNRTLSKAKEVAIRHNCNAISFNDLNNSVAQADIIFCATRSQTPIITAEIITDIMAQRTARTMLIVDISMPHNVEPAVGKVSNVFLNDMLDLEANVQKNLSRRAEEIPNVKRIINQEIAAFDAQQATLKVGPLIRDLRQSFEDLRNSELQRFKSKFNEDDFSTVEHLTKNLVNKLLHWPTMEIRALAQEPDCYIEKLTMLKSLFGLEKTANERKKK